MQYIIFSETDLFFSQLDDFIKKGPTAIRISEERVGNDSKLWRRLKKCDNWNEIEKEFKKIQGGEDSPLKRVISSNFQAALTGLEIALLAWVATLIAGILAYGIYKGCKVKFSGNSDGDIDIEITPN
ncbi:hypothetical protein [Duganella vulcania]|uniref:Uncharacterized protein n=1 Tax=Duganella vulcania TaxID=2692166 RepID=A0A845GQS7_9BURK|nr:hypothetical protein [Duganella vulcania]MYM95790.1 hypothetical protein [Duganella vulcania]